MTTGKNRIIVHELPECKEDLSVYDPSNLCLVWCPRTLISAVAAAFLFNPIIWVKIVMQPQIIQDHDQEVVILPGRQKSHCESNQGNSLNWKKLIVHLWNFSLLLSWDPMTRCFRALFSRIFWSSVAGCEWRLHDGNLTGLCPISSAHQSIHRNRAPSSER